MTAELDAVLATLRTIEDRQRFRKFDFFKAYPKQQAFFDMGLTYRERLLMAGNRQGKTYAGAYETTAHLTGLYADDWFGRRWARPVKAWAAGESSLLVRDVQQKMLCGEPGVEGALGTGMIPKECFFDKPSLARGVTDAYDTIQVKHSNNGGDTIDGISVLRFKSYEQGRTKFQGEELDFGWLDEEPDEEIYTEALTRTMGCNGIIILTFTPLKGRSKVVLRFLDDPSPTRNYVSMTLMDAEHIPEEQRAAIIASYPEHQREARVNGTPMMGEGLVYEIAPGMISEPAIDMLPPHWTKLWSVDFGISEGHPFAAVLSAWDKDADTIHVIHTIKMKGGLPLNHAVPMKQIGAAVPVAWPHDGNNRDKGSGEVLSKLYKAQGLLTLPMHTTWPDGGYTVEPGILEIMDRMNTGRFKVAAHLSDWFEEQRFYHRKDGLIVKSHDDILDATRIGVMGKRFGRPVQLGGQGVHRSRRQVIANDVDFDLS